MKSVITARDVGRLANVSQSAVSRTFTPGASVSEVTRRKVLKAAAELGYRPNALARGLITKRSNMIGLMMTYLENQFYPLVIERLSQQLQRQGQHVLLFVGELEQQVDDVLQQVLQYQIDGLVMASAVLSSDLAKACADSGVPVVMLNRLAKVSRASHLAAGSVTTDNEQGGWLAGRLLIERGHKKIAFLSGLENSSTSIDRERGLMRALAEASLALHSRAVGGYSFEAAQAATRELFSQSNHQLNNRPDAIFVANDHMAIAVLDVLRHELGLRVPQEVSVIGFDDVPQAAWKSYQLTTVLQDVDAMVEATVALLNDMQLGHKPRRVVLPCKLIERGSVRA